MPREEAIVTDIEAMVEGTPVDLPPETPQEGSLEQNLASREEVIAEDDIEIEVVDDTPEEDRGREPLPDEIKQKLDSDDELENASERTKQRIQQLKKAWHDERRERETYQRQMNEAVEMARRQMSEAEQLRQTLQQGEQWALEQAKQRADYELQFAQQKYKEAYESGDSDAFAQASSDLARATATKQQADAMQPQYQNWPQQYEIPLQPQYPEQYYNQQQGVKAPPIDDRTKQWAEDNPWFGQDAEKTSFALGVHQKLVDEGISPESEPDVYYERLNARISEVFGSERSNKRPSTVVAGAKRTPARGKKVVLTQSQLAIAKKLGISPQAYAKELIKEQERSHG